MAGVALCFLAASVRNPARAAETLLLDVVVNGYKIGEIGQFEQDGRKLSATAEELHELGFKVPADAGRAGRQVPLDRLPGITWRVNQATQTLYVTAPMTSLLPKLLKFAPSTADIPLASGTGAVLNYDLTGTSSAGDNVASGELTLRGFSPWGALSSSQLVFAGASPRGPGSNDVIRLDSTYVYADPDSLRRYQLGDFISSGLPWTRPVRMGGIAIDTDFAIRPDLITTPLPSVSGSVAAPSTIDVLVNGTHLLSRQVQPGPFEIPQLPVTTGAGTIALVVTDALGRRTTTTLPFYAASSLLKPGLQAFSMEAGVLRRGWGVISDDYGDPAGSATYQRGLSDDLTMSAHAEATRGEAMAGGGVAANLANLAVLTLSAAGSTAAGRSGWLLSAGAQRAGRTFSLGVTASLAAPNFRDIAAMNDDPQPRRQITANAGVSLGRFGSLSVAYLGVYYAAQPALVSFYAAPGTLGSSGETVSYQPPQHMQILTASYSLQLGPTFLSATAFHDFAEADSTGILFNITIPLGERSSASASVNGGAQGGYSQVQVQQTAEAVGQAGYQAYASDGVINHQFANATYKSPWGQVTGGVDRIGRQTTLSAEVEGSLSYSDGGAFASNTIDDSFAVVDTDGIGGVRVMDENRRVGVTDAAGRLLLPDLQSFDRNHISIDPTDLPIDATIPYVTQDVRPQYQSGVVVRFPIKISHSALIRLVDADRRALPLGSVATLHGTRVQDPVGYDGDVYVQDLRAHNTLTVERPDGRRCTVHFTYHFVPNDIPTLGPLRCDGSEP